MIEILLVDDHPSVGEGTKLMIEKEEDMKATVVFSAGQAVEILQKRDFDLMLFDLRMPGMNGIELTKKVKSMGKKGEVLIYTGYDVKPYFNMLVEAGAAGFISKTETREQLIKSLRCASEGKVILPQSLFKELRRTEAWVKDAGDEEEIEEVTINSREQHILEQVAAGKSNKEIAEAMFKSQRTIEYHLTEIFRKLNVRSRAEAALAAKRMGIISDDIEA